MTPPIVVLRLGIVGLPNVGKSTLFNALTAAKALVANYPFATIEPNTGIVQVPDPRLDALARIVQPGAHRARGGRVRGHRRAGQGRERGRRAGQPVPGEHPRGRRHRPRRPLLRGRRHPARDGRGRSGARPRDHQHRARAWPTWPAWRSGWTRPPAPPSRATPRPSSSSGVLEAGARRAGRRPARARRRRPTEEEAAAYRSFNLLTAKPVLYAANVAEDEIAAGNAHVEALRGALDRDQRDRRGRHLLRQGRGGAGRAGPGGPGGVPRVARAHRIRARPAGPRGVPPARPPELLHRRREGGPGLDHPPGRQGAGRRRRDPLGLREGLHPGRDGGVRATSCGSAAGSRPASRASPGRRARSTWCRTAT